MEHWIDAPGEQVEVLRVALPSRGEPLSKPFGSARRREHQRVWPRTTPVCELDLESRAWWVSLHGSKPVREGAIAELYERLRREARFQILRRARAIPEIPSSDVDDLAMQAAGDALLAILRKLDDYRGESQFWTWARRFAQLEAPVSIRRRLGRDRLVSDPALTFEVPDPGSSPQERAEIRERLATVSELIADRLTARQRTILIAVAIDGVPTAELATELDTTCGAIYKTLHDARKKLTTELALC